ncbi:MAG TPA: UbiA family prenyltransferase [Candidatus Krumholzibacteria bacterium]|nr:UbiA family prenyltransferase [Candidatus Krumholzibacteria bacterium]
MADFLFVLRPLILVPAWAFYSLGAHTHRIPRAVEHTAIIQSAFWCLSSVLACAYVLNQIFDLESDRLNGKGLFLTRRVFRPRTMLLIALVAFATASLLLRNTHHVQHIPLTAALLLSLIYSLPPLRLCSRPWWDLAANAIGYGGLAYVIGHGALSNDLMPAIMGAVPWVLLVAGTFLHTTILDVEGDAAAGKHTTTVVFGERRSALLSVGFGAAAFALSVAPKLRATKGASWLPAIVTGGALLAFAYAYHRLTRSREMSVAERYAVRARTSSYAVQVPTALVALGAAWRDPWFLILLLPLVAFTHVYNHARFGVSYPGWPSYAKLAQSPVIPSRKPDVRPLTVEPGLRDVSATPAHSMTSEAE